MGREGGERRRSFGGKGKQRSRKGRWCGTESKDTPTRMSRVSKYKNRLGKARAREVEDLGGRPPACSLVRLSIRPPVQSSACLSTGQPWSACVSASSPPAKDARLDSDRWTDDSPPRAVSVSRCLSAQPVQSGQSQSHTRTSTHARTRTHTHTHRPTALAQRTTRALIDAERRSDPAS